MNASTRVLRRISRAHTLDAELARHLRADAAEQRSGQYPLVEFQDDPVGYVKKRLHVAILMPHQVELLEALCEGVHGRASALLAMRSCQKAGKTACIIWAALWFYECFPACEVLMCAAIETQTRGVLWKQLRETLAFAETQGALIDGELSRSPATGFISSDGSRLIRSVSGRDIEALAGVSGRQLVIIDEASHLPEGKFKAFVGNQQGAASGEMAGAILLTGNPTKNAGPFFEAFHSMKEHWQTFHVSAFDVADWQVANDTRIPFTANHESIAKAKAMFGENDVFYIVRVLGNFLYNETGRAIPMVRIVEAKERWKEAPDEGPLAIGYDIAGDGQNRDEHCWAIVRGAKCLDLVRRRGLDDEAALAATYEIMQLYANGAEVPELKVDADGPIGARIFGRLRAESEHRRFRNEGQKFNVHGIKGSLRFVRDKTKFLYVREEVIWSLSQWMKDGAIPDDPKLHGELYAPVWESLPTGQIRSTPKPELRRILGRSPDSFDALALAVWQPRTWGVSEPDKASQAPETDRVFDPYSGIAAAGGYGGTIDPYG